MKDFVDLFRMWKQNLKVFYFPIMLTHASGYDLGDSSFSSI